MDELDNAMHKIEAQREGIAPEPLNFEQAVMAALKNRNVKAQCKGCGIFGWAAFVLHPSPVVMPTVVTNEVILSACLICTKCGATRLFNLNLLGMKINLQQPEQPRIVIPH